jgi:2-dehydro-3-deoxyphosphogluconate aldolase/(4S)-4-hydroxy-2-oxoglutarate aldolase
LRFCPTGGINEANVAEWLAVPGVIAVGGSWLVPDDKVEAQDWQAITEIVRRNVERCGAIAPPGAKKY